MPKDSEVEFQNEKEWRRYQIKRMDALEAKFDARMGGLETRMTSLEILGATLKVKVGMVSAFFGAVAGTLSQLFKH